MIRGSKYMLTVLALSAVALFGFSSQASADPTCGVNANGGATFATGVNLGTITSTCTIGAAPNTGGVTDNAALSSSNPESIYEFYFGGGSLAIQEILGNQGTSNDVFLELDSMTALDAATGTLVPGASIQIPHMGDTAGQNATLTSNGLAAGYYAINTYFAPSGTADPQFEMFVTATPSVATPEPGSALLLGIGLLGFAMFSGRKAFSV